MESSCNRVSDDTAWKPGTQLSSTTKEWKEVTSITYNANKPLFTFLPWFGLNLPLKVTKKTFCFYLLYIIFQLCLCLFSVAKAIKCLVGGTEIPMNPKNISLYIASFGLAINGVLFLGIGLVYIPKRLKKTLASIDKLRENTQFEVSHDNLSRRDKLFTTVLVAEILFVPIGIIFTNPPFTETVSCFESPVSTPSVEYWVNIIHMPIYCTYFIGQRLVIYRLLHIFCFILRKEFERCDDEFKEESTLTGEHVERIRNRYFLIYKLSKDIDDVLSPFVTLAIIVLFTTLCLFILPLVHGSVNEMQIGGFMFFVIFTVSELLYILIQGSCLHEASNCLLEKTMFLDGAKMNQDTVGMVTMFIENIKSCDVGLSFMKLFIIDKSAVTTIIGSLITYVIVVIQFQAN